MKQIRFIIIGISIVSIIASLFNIDYHDLTSRSNLGSYLMIVSMICVSLAMILSNRHETKNKTKTKEASGYNSIPGLKNKGTKT